jgi:Adenosine deaminase
MTSSDPARVWTALSYGRAAVRRLLDGPPREPSAGATAYFRYYRAVEAQCRWMEYAGRGTRDLYSRGAVALAENALYHGVTTTCLFFSLTADRNQMIERILGLADACCHLVKGGLTVRLTVPRTRPLHRSYARAELLELLTPLMTQGLLAGFDLSGLDSEVSVERTMEMVEWLLRLREAASQHGRRLSVSAHYGESTSPDGMERMLRLAMTLATIGVDSMGHGILLWSPETYDYRGEEVAAVLAHCRSAAMTFEVCPTVARMYGCRWDTKTLPAALKDLGDTVAFGSDAPGLLGYEGLREATMMRFSEE